MISEQTHNDLMNLVKTFTTDDINKLILDFSQIREERANEERRAAAKKVVEAITEYLALGEEISVRGAVYDEEWGGDEDVEGTFDVCDNCDGYLTFNFI